MWSGRIDNAERHLREGAALAHKTGQPYLEITCLSNLAFALKFRSSAAARRHSEETIALAERYGWEDERVIIPALAALGTALICTGDFSAGEPWLARATKLGAPDANPPVGLLLHFAKGMLFVSRSQLREALTEFESAERMQSLMLGEHLLAAQSTAWRIAVEVRLGMLDEARASLNGTPAERAKTAEMRNADALISLVSGDPSLALDKLHDVVGRRVPIVHDYVLVEAHLLAAHAYDALGKERDSQRAVESALAVAEHDRLVFPFALTRSRELLKKQPLQTTAHAALLLEIVDILAGAPSRTGTAILPLNELSHTELRVLGYLPTNLSRPEIARELRVSVNTVNTHMRNIYSKLGAESRTEAVERARGLRLLAH
jgi:LuxR family maltose regulon positive regulatory protein